MGAYHIHVATTRHGAHNDAQLGYIASWIPANPFRAVTFGSHFCNCPERVRGPRVIHDNQGVKPHRSEHVETDVVTAEIALCGVDASLQGEVMHT